MATRAPPMLFSALLPSAVKRSCCRRAFGCAVRNGLGLVDASTDTFGDGVRTGQFNVSPNLNDFRVGRGSYPANFNHASGGPHEATVNGRLLVGDHVQRR